MKKFYVKKIVETPSGPTLIETDHKYLIVNVDEPYAEAAFELIKNHEKEKGTWDDSDDFNDFIKNI